jgi:hypothetical protein
MVIAGACTYPNQETSHQPSSGSGGTHLFDDALPCADGVPIVELMLGKEVKLGYFSSVLDLIDCSLKLGLAGDNHERWQTGRLPKAL